MEFDFEEIRCYKNEEVHEAFERLSEEKQFMKVLSTIVYPLLPKDVIKQRLLSFQSSYVFQKEMVYPFLQYLEANMTKGIKLNGLEKIDVSKAYLYISNHRDIILDSAFLCGKFIENNMNTVEIAIGDNLLIHPWIEDLVRVNKSFIVKRGLSARHILESSKRLSAYIATTISENQSIWIAQREGRAKDSNDRTQESLLKMLNMYGTESFIENITKLNICPLSISYEYDPCDFLKAKEMQLRRDNPDFKKDSKDDLLSMQTGVMGYKGKVVYEITGVLNKELKRIAEETSSRNEQITLVAELIDKRIHANYNIFANNKIAFDIIKGGKLFTKEYTTLEKLDFERYLSLQIAKIDLENKDESFLRTKLLEMYANPLINKLHVSPNYLEEGE